MLHMQLVYISHTYSSKWVAYYAYKVLKYVSSTMYSTYYIVLVAKNLENVQQ